jgi:hypothetical protein
MRSPYNREYRGDKWDLGTKVMYRPEIGDDKDQPRLGQMNRHFERLGAFCAPQSAMVS